MSDRLKHYKRGHASEKLAAAFLWLKLYKIRARRYKTKLGEIDLIATRNRQIVFCEVKARPGTLEGLEAVSFKSQQRIEKAAQLFVQKYPQFKDYVWRFDVVVVRPWSLPYHLKDAWRPLWR